MSAPPNCKLIGRWRIVEADNDDGSIEIEFAYHNGDEAVLKAKPILLQQPAGTGEAEPPT
jgi:hypothetical protein